MPLLDVCSPACGLLSTRSYTLSRSRTIPGVFPIATSPSICIPLSFVSLSFLLLSLHLFPLFFIIFLLLWLLSFVFLFHLLKINTLVYIHLLPPLILPLGLSFVRLLFLKGMLDLHFATCKLYDSRLLTSGYF